jgi:hypothetical protein
MRGLITMFLFVSRKVSCIVEDLSGFVLDKLLVGLGEASKEECHY